MKLNFIKYDFLIFLAYQVTKTKVRTLTPAAFHLTNQENDHKDIKIQFLWSILQQWACQSPSQHQGRLQELQHLTSQGDYCFFYHLLMRKKSTKNVATFMVANLLAKSAHWLWTQQKSQNHHEYIFLNFSVSFNLDKWFLKLLL